MNQVEIIKSLSKQLDLLVARNLFERKKKKQKIFNSFKMQILMLKVIK